MPKDTEAPPKGSWRKNLAHSMMLPANPDSHKGGVGIGTKALGRFAIGDDLTRAKKWSKKLL